MNPYQKKMCRGLMKLMAELFADPEEERKYREWLAQREEKRAQAATEERATPMTAATV